MLFRSLTNDKDVPAIPAQFSEILIYGAMMRAHELKNDLDKLKIIVPRYNQVQHRLDRWLAENRERFGELPFRDAWRRFE